MNINTLIIFMKEFNPLFWRFKE